MREITLTSIKVTNVEKICMETEDAEEEGPNIKRAWLGEVPQHAHGVLLPCVYISSSAPMTTLGGDVLSLGRCALLR